MSRMASDLLAQGSDLNPMVSQAPVDDSRVIVFKLTLAVAEQLRPSEGSADSSRGLEQMLAHLDTNRTTTHLDPLFASNAIGNNRGENWHFADEQSATPPSMAGSYLLR